MDEKSVHGGNRLIKLYQGMAACALHPKPASLNALTQAGISEYGRKSYFNIVKKLYGICFLCQHGNADAYGDHYEALEKQWAVLRELCINSQMIYKHTATPGTSDPSQVPDSIKHFRFTYHYPELENGVYIASFDDFRLLVEMELCGKSVEWYLLDRYQVLPRKDSNGEYCGLSKPHDSETHPKYTLSLSEMTAVLNSIKADIQHSNNALSKHNNAFPVMGKSNSSYVTRQQYLALMDARDEWIAKRQQFDRELYWLSACLDIVESIVAYFDTPATQTTDNADLTLYVHKGQIICHKQKHDIEQATAIMQNIRGNEIKLNVSHCLFCNKFFILHSVYNTYREKYGTVLGDIKLLSGESFDSYSPDLAAESILHLCGYSVSQKSKLSMVDRQAIIAAVIDSGAMSKGQVINLLQYLIDLSQKKDNMKYAIDKWHEDLEFTLAYNTAQQSHYHIHKVSAYAKNKFIIHPKAAPSSGQTNSSYIGMTVIHHDPKFGRGRIIAAYKETVTIQFDNGKCSDFSKMIFTKNIAHIESKPSISTSSSVTAPTSDSANAQQNIKINCVFRSGNTCTNPDAPRFKKECALCMYFTDKDNFKIAASNKKNPQNLYLKPSKPTKPFVPQPSLEKIAAPANPKEGCIYLEGNCCKIKNAPCNCGSGHCLFYKAK